MTGDGERGAVLTDHEHEHDGQAHRHDHPHTSPHEHSHECSQEHGVAPVSETAPRGGPVLLDIGGEIGAVIAHLDDEQEGTELAILSLDDPDWDPHTHTGVWRRALAGRTVMVAVYPELKAGRYRIVVPAGPTREFEVVGGRVTDIDLTTST